MDKGPASDACARNKLIQRVLTLFWRKCLGSTLVISVFFVVYFMLLRQAPAVVYTMPLLKLDRWMPVLPWSIWLYFSLWVYICMPSSLMVRGNQLAYYLMGAGLLSLAGLSVFYLLPTAVPAWGIDWRQYPSLFFLKQSDASGNACPSLHVAFALYSGLWLARVLKFLEIKCFWHGANVLWCLLIVLSTLTTKQHVVIDVLCGAALGIFIFWLNDRIAHSRKINAFTA